MSKYTFYSLLGTVAVARVLIAIGFVTFYSTRRDVTIVTVPFSTSPLDVSQDGDVRLLDMITLLRKDAIPAILEPQFASPQSAEKHMTDTEQVIGVFINGDARAYPIEILSDHEIVNYVVGGEPIAVTW